MSRRVRAAIVTGVLFVVLGASNATPRLWAARVFVPELELFLRVSPFSTDGQFLPSLDTMATIRVDVEASDKLGATIRLGHAGNFSQKIVLGNQVINQLISVELISLTVGKPFESPVYIGIFSGVYDKIGSGDDFQRIFNIDGIGSFYRGYRYFDAATLYDAMHTIDGTGLVVASEFGSNFISARLYLYKDTPTYELITGSDNTVTATEIDTGAYSTDFRAMFDADRLQLDIYVGATFNTIFDLTDPTQISPGYSVRTGIMANFGINELFQLFMHFGVPYIVEIERASFTNISISHFQILLEPRFNIEDSFGLHLTFLVRPLTYNNDPYGDPGVDLNAKVFFGSYAAEFGRGGFDTRIEFGSDFSFEGVRVIPFFGFTAGGVVWDLGIDFPILPFDANRFLSNLNVTVGAKTSF